MANPLIAPPPLVYPDFGLFLTYAESVKSATAIRKGITNVPNAQQYRCMARVYSNVFLPICQHFGKLPVTSFFRSARLNQAIGGAKNSAHLRGQAIDIDCDGLRNVSNRQLFDWARTNLSFDQLILESPDQHGNPAWIHIAWVSQLENRGEVLKMVRRNGVSTYERI